MLTIRSCLVIAITIGGSVAGTLRPRSSSPLVKSAQEIGLVIDPKLNRDSCVSTRVGAREFWNCRDSSNYPGQPFFIYTSTASWTNFNTDGTPAVVNGNLSTYPPNTQVYFDSPSNECPPAGGCSDGSRWLIWPDSPPLPVNNGNGGLYLYTWIRNVHQSSSGTRENSVPPTSLYRAEWGGSDTDDSLPTVVLLDEAFWPSNSIPFGDYGWLIGLDGFAYLYGQAQYGAVVARVDPTKIEDQSAYSYYSQHTGWTLANGTMPSYTDPNAPITNCGTGQQGTFYYSGYFGSYVWIGGKEGDDTEFQITRAPNPWGPWTEPTTFYTGTPGTKFSGYSWQAHPGMSEDRGNGSDIYLTFTRVNDYYENPLIYVVWK